MPADPVEQQPMTCRECVYRDATDGEFAPRGSHRVLVEPCSKHRAAHDVTTERPYIVGYACPSRPDGPLKPTPFEDPCGKDKAVWSDGTMTDA